MSFELLYPLDVLLVAVVAAFAVSSLVGMLLACLWVLQRPLFDLPSERGPRRLRSDPALEDLAPSGAAGRIVKAFKAPR